MKKTILILIAIISFGFSANAQLSQQELSHLTPAQQNHYHKWRNDLINGHNYFVADRERLCRNAPSVFRNTSQCPVEYCAGMRRQIANSQEQLKRSLAAIDNIFRRSAETNRAQAQRQQQQAQQRAQDERNRQIREHNRQVDERNRQIRAENRRRQQERNRQIAAENRRRAEEAARRQAEEEHRIRTARADRAGASARQQSTASTASLMSNVQQSKAQGEQLRSENTLARLENRNNINTGSSRMGNLARQPVEVSVYEVTPREDMPALGTTSFEFMSEVETDVSNPISFELVPEVERKSINPLSATMTVSGAAQAIFKFPAVKAAAPKTVAFLQGTALFGKGVAATTVQTVAIVPVLIVGTVNLYATLTSCVIQGGAPEYCGSATEILLNDWGMVEKLKEGAKKDLITGAIGLKFPVIGATAKLGSALWPLFSE